jgi:RNA polymerase sigma factor (sigma-70 family)
MEYLYDRYSASLYGVIVRIVKDEDMAEEVLQDCFLRIWNKIPDYDAKKGRLFTWMVNIGRNLAIDKTRSKDFRGNAKSEDIQFNVSIRDEHYSDNNKPEYIGVHELLDNLNPEQKQMLDLMYFQGYTQSEISEEFGIPLGTVKTRVRGAINRLRKFFLS